MEQLGELAQSGILGLLLTLSISANIFLYKEAKKAFKDSNDQRDARIKDLKETKEKLIEPVKAIQSTVQIIHGYIQAKTNDNK